MDKNGIVAVFLLFFIVADVSDASLLSAFRRFVAVASMGSFGTSHVNSLCSCVFGITFKEMII